jgi:hypothetical protein
LSLLEDNAARNGCVVAAKKPKSARFCRAQSSAKKWVQQQRVIKTGAMRTPCAMRSRTTSTKSGARSALDAVVFNALVLLEFGSLDCGF